MISYSSSGLRQAHVLRPVTAPDEEPLTFAPELADKLYSYLIDLAEQGKPCPPNSELTATFGTKSLTYMSLALGELERAGRVAIERRPAAKIRRIVTILATGKRTAAV